MTCQLHGFTLQQALGVFAKTCKCFSNQTSLAEGSQKGFEACPVFSAVHGGANDSFLIGLCTWMGSEFGVWGVLFTQHGFIP